MLNREIQRALAQRYGAKPTGLIKEGFDSRVEKGFHVEFNEEREEHAAVLLIDIAGFSHRVSGYSPTELREYLDAFYGRVMPMIFENGGFIDRIAGDGILAVFSPFFLKDIAPATCDRNALLVADQLVHHLSRTIHPLKAALSSGELMFCNTGVAEVYQECTVLGAPLTVAYRLEEIAKRNQVIIEETESFAAIIDRQTQTTSLTRFTSGSRDFHFDVKRAVLDLRGVGQTAVIVETHA